MKTRNLHTKIWTDDWFANLSAVEKLLFMYLLTNKEVNLNGIYELSDRIILFETGVSRDQLEKAKEKFREKILVENGWVIIRNVDKYDDYKSGTLVKAKESQLKDIPKHIRDRAIEYKDSLSIAYQESGIGYAYPNSNSNSNSNSNFEVLETFTGDLPKGQLLKKENKSAESITDDDLAQIAEKYNVPIGFVISKLEDLQNYCASHGKKYKDYKAALRDWVKRDSIKIKQEHKPRIAVMPQEL